MKFGAMIFATDRCMNPVELAVEIERRGLDSFFIPEHTHIPTNTTSPFFPDGQVPPPYLRTYDPFVVLGACAAVTKKINLGTGICLVSQRHPITLAKEVATVDRLSNGRFIFGVGAGWNKPEVENHGVAFSKRWSVLRERILAMREIWTKDEAEYHGEFVNFDKMWSFPKPIQHGGPPVWVGSNSKYVSDRVAEYADGWIPIGGREGGGTVDRINASCAKYNRDPSEITLAHFLSPMDESALQSLKSEGYTHFVFGLPSESKEHVLPVLDKIGDLVKKIG